MRCPATSIVCRAFGPKSSGTGPARSEEHTSELQSRLHLVCRLLLEKKKQAQSSQNLLRFHAMATRHLQRTPFEVRRSVIIIWHSAAPLRTRTHPSTTSTAGAHSST